MNDKKCKYCATMIAKEAKVCPQCGKELGLLTLPAKIFLGILLIPVALWLYADFRAYFGVTSPYSVADKSSPETADKSSPETKEVKLATGCTFNGYTLNDRERSVRQSRQRRASRDHLSFFPSPGFRLECQDVLTWGGCVGDSRTGSRALEPRRSGRRRGQEGCAPDLLGRRRGRQPDRHRT